RGARRYRPCRPPAKGCQQCSSVTSGPLGRGADQDEAAVRTGNRALDEQQTLLRVNGVDGQVLGGDPLVAHTARHALALEHTTRGGATADGAGGAVLALRAVTGAGATEVVALPDAGEALALALPGHVDLHAGLEDLDGDVLAERVLGGVRRADLDEVTTGGDVRLGEVALEGLVHLARVDVAEGDLDGLVAVDVVRADLGDDVGAGLDDGDRNNTVVLVPHLRHAELLAQDALDLLSHLQITGLRA